MNSVWFVWLLRVVGMMTAVWGIGMLIANRSSPDPLNPAALALAAVAGVLLLIVSYAASARLNRPHGEGTT